MPPLLKSLSLTRSKRKLQVKRRKKSVIQSRADASQTVLHRLKRFLNGQYLIDEWREHPAEELKTVRPLLNR